MKSNNLNSKLNSSCFRLLSPEDWDTISVGHTKATFKKGELIIKQGLGTNQVIFITNGFVLQSIETEKDRLVNVDILREGDFIGIPTLLGVNSCNYTYKALTHVDVILLKTDVLNSLLKTNPSFLLKLLKRAAEDENALIQFHARLTYKQIHGRLALTLLFLTENRIQEINIFRLLTRKDIANFAGISYINVTKALKEFEKEELIKLKGKDIYILDRAKLEQYSQLG